MINLGGAIVRLFTFCESGIRQLRLSTVRRLKQFIGGHPPRCPTSIQPTGDGFPQHGSNSPLHHWRGTVALKALIQTVLRNADPAGYLSNKKVTFRHLLDHLNLEFF